jgi:CNT family concentrative nucleoside transporter
MITPMTHLVGLLGLVVLMGIAWLFSTNRRAVDWRLVGAGLLLQLVFAAIVLLFPPGRAFFDLIRHLVTRFLAFTYNGSEFVFGDLARPNGNVGMVFAFYVLPSIIFFSATMSVLYHLGIMQRVVGLMARFMTKVMGVSGSESLSVAANVFIGQTEAPLVVRPYIAQMTQAELMVLMTGGFATIAGSVLAGYISFGIDAGHLLAASVMSAPAALVIARIMVPETEESLTRGKVQLHLPKTTSNLVEAAAEGCSQGMKLALNVAAMLIGFIALIAVFDAVLAKGGSLIGLAWWPSSLHELFGYLLWPIAWVMGVPAHDCFKFAGLLGTKISINEFVAYADLAKYEHASALSPRASVIATYALCGFANFGSIGIQLGGIGPLAPERRGDLARLGLRAMIGGALASWMTATIAGLMI